MPLPEASPSKDHGAGFGDQAALYAAYRPGYPKEIFERLLAHLEGSRELAVDLGAGSGQATRELAQSFAHVIAVEPDPRMAALLPRAENITVLTLAAEDAEFSPQSIDAVISATAFHWMDQPKVCAGVARWLRPGGIFFPFLYGPFRMEGAAAEIYRSHSALWGPFRDARLGSNVDYERPIRESGAFHIVERVGMEMKFALTAEDATGLILTMSYASAYARANGGVAAYRERLLADFGAAGDGVVAAAHLGGIIARR